jgi:hypothetical protein
MIDMAIASVVDQIGARRVLSQNAIARPAPSARALRRDRASEGEGTAGSPGLVRALRGKLIADPKLVDLPAEAEVEGVTIEMATKLASARLSRRPRLASTTCDCGERPRPLGGVATAVLSMPVRP